MTGSLCAGSQFFISSRRALAAAPPSRWSTTGPAIMRLPTISDPTASAVESPNLGEPGAGRGREHQVLRIDAGRQNAEAGGLASMGCRCRR
jgi:hypothetical protein